MDILVYTLLNKKIDGVASGVESAVVDGTKITFNMKNGSSQSMQFPSPKDGVSVKSLYISDGGHLICSMSNGEDVDAGEIPIEKGVDGYSPTISESPDNTDSVYRLNITDSHGTFTTPNLIGNGDCIELPYLENGCLFLNGHAAVISSVEANTNKASYFIGSESVGIEFADDVLVFGGGKNNSVHSSSIVLDSGHIRAVYGGSYGDGNCGVSSIIVNGGSCGEIYGGGYCLNTENAKGNHTGVANIVINNTDSKISIYGGGQNASVGQSDIRINNGLVQDVTAGGVKSLTSVGRVNIKNGVIDMIQSTCNGSVGFADIYILGGSVGTLYAGAEPTSDNDGSFGCAGLHILNGKVNNLATGHNNSSEYIAEKVVSGEYKARVIKNETDALKLFKLTKIESINNGDGEYPVISF